MNTNTPQTVIFMGRSGSGKGTQAVLLKEYLEKSGGAKVLHLETGTLFREFITGDSLTARLATKIYQQGSKNYDFLAIDLIVEYFKKNYSGEESIFIDGAPRSELEAVLLDNLLEFYERFDANQFEKPKVIYVDVSVEWAIDKLQKRGRSDDSEVDKMKTKMEWFESDVMPAIEYLKNNKHFDFIHINGEQTIEEVRQEIMNKI